MGEEAPTVIRKAAIVEFLERKYGRAFDIAENRLVAAVPALNTEILQGDADRIGYIVINLSVANTLYLYFAPVAGVPAGIVLGAGGGALAVDADVDGALPSRRVLAGATAYPTAIYTLEILGV